MGAGTYRGVIEPLVARSNVWIRAPESGIFRTYYALGQSVNKNDVLGNLPGRATSVQLEIQGDRGDSLVIPEIPLLPKSPDPKSDLKDDQS